VKSIKSNVIFNIAKNISTIAFQVITFPYISRVLMAENVGKINFGLSIVSYFSLIATLGITTYAIRECSAVRGSRKNLEKVASEIYSINIVTTIVAYVALGITLILCSKLKSYRLLIIIQSMSIMFTTLGADWLNSAIEDFKYIGIRTIVFQIVSVILMFIFVQEPDDYLKYVLISLISSSGANLVNIWYRRKFCSVRIIRLFNWKKHFYPILYMFVMILAQNIFNNVDSTMLGLMHGDREVGIYSVAHKINLVLNQLVASIVWVIMPRVSYYFAENNYIELNKLLRKVLGFYITLGLPCAVGTIVLADDIVLLVAGNHFDGASTALRILMIGFIVSLYGGNFLGNTILLPSKQEKYYMIVCCVTAVVNVILNFFFIPRYGANAAAATTTVCAVIILIMLLIRKNREVQIDRIIKLFQAPVLGSILIVCICVLLRRVERLWVRISFSIICSVVSYVLVQVIWKNEIVQMGMEKLFYHKKDAN